jgi:sulfhydrogenase subunit beta (sulfur reductase)
MVNPYRPDTGDTVSIEKPALNTILQRLTELGYQTLGPRVRNGTLIYGRLDEMDELPKGYVSEQSAGRFRLIHTGHSRYFDVIPGAQSWKQFLFPPRLDLFKLQREGARWRAMDGRGDAPAYAFIGVRACELAAIQVQDRVFLREDFVDPEYRARREHAFVVAVNCLHPAGTCFCGSVGRGPRAGSGYDLCLTELEDVFLVTVGSELGRNVLASIEVTAASAFVLGLAEAGLQQAEQATREGPGTNGLTELIEANLESEHWEDVAKRCLGCGNCTLVCPTCFCWDAIDHTNLNGTETGRERVWDSCFNPGYSYQAGGNIRPSIRARYRQWMSHKFGTWQAQQGTTGCVGCGRCITWCPAEIDVRKELAALQKEAV